MKLSIYESEGRYREVGLGDVEEIIRADEVQKFCEWLLNSEFELGENGFYEKEYGESWSLKEVIAEYKARKEEQT